MSEAYLHLEQTVKVWAQTGWKYLNAHGQVDVVNDK